MGVDLLVALDPGTSMSKIVYHVVGDDVSYRPDILCMEPELISVDKKSIDIYESRKLQAPYPENEAWVELDEKVYVVGFLARKYFDARNRLKDLKYENSIPKILAAVGSIAAKMGIGQEFNLSLALLLPYGEWEDRKKLQKGLVSALESFIFRGCSFKVNLKIFECMPEGGGLVLTRSRKLGADFNSMNIAALMFGYRDMSCVVFERGISSGNSEGFGMVWMLEKIKNLTSGQNLHDLVKPVHVSGSKPSRKHLKHLVRSRKEEFREQEIAQLVDVIASVRKEYWNVILDWLFVNIPSNVDLVIVGGGTSNYFRQELKNYFSGTEISWAAELEQDVVLAFNVSAKKDELALRFTDVYGLFRYLQKISGVPVLGSEV